MFLLEIVKKFPLLNPEIPIIVLAENIRRKKGNNKLQHLMACDTRIVYGLIFVVDDYRYSIVRQDFRASVYFINHYSYSYLYNQASLFTKETDFANFYDIANTVYPRLSVTCVEDASFFYSLKYFCNTNYFPS